MVILLQVEWNQTSNFNVTGIVQLLAMVCFF